MQELIVTRCSRKIHCSDAHCLLASTAVVLSAGVAAADVTLSGDAWMGLKYDNSRAANKTQMISRARVTFTLSGETDAGMAFGGSFRADNAAASTTTPAITFGTVEDATAASFAAGEAAFNAVIEAGGTVEDAEAAADAAARAVVISPASSPTGGAVNGRAGSVFISGDFGRLAMGDVDSALEATWFRTRHIGVLENAGGSRTSALGAGTTPRALYTYSIDGFTVALGAGQFTSGSQQYSIGAKYEMDGYGVAAGFERNGMGSRHILVSGQVNFDPVSVHAFAGQVRVNAADAALATALGVAAGQNHTQYGLDVHASFDGIGVQVRGKRDFANNNHLGAGVTYGLGGGATLGASVNRVSGGSTTADFGLAFSF